MPKKTTLADLREHMFATIEALTDTENPMDIERARAISDVGKRVIDSAKVEIDFLKVTGITHGSGFFGEEEPKKLDGSKKTGLTPEQERRTKQLFPNGQGG